MSTKQKLIDASTRHQIFLNRYSLGTLKIMAPFIQDAVKKVEELLSAGTITEFQKNRLNTQLSELKQLLKVIFANMNKALDKQWISIAKYEAQFTTRMISTATNNVNTILPPLSAIKEGIFTTVFDRIPGFKVKTGTTIGTAMDAFGAQKAGEMVNTIRQGFILGRTNEQIRKDMQSLVKFKTNNQARTLTRTIVQHIAAQAKDTVYHQHKDIIIGYEVVATLDDRTSLTCAALDGKIFDIDEFEFPPYHWNCRSTYVPVFSKEAEKGSDVTGTRPAKGSEGITQEKTNTTYNAWLKGQSDKFVDEVLGKERRELFRSGVHVDKFVDRNFKPISLTELRKLDGLHNN